MKYTFKKEMGEMLNCDLNRTYIEREFVNIYIFLVWIFIQKNKYIHKIIMKEKIGRNKQSANF